MADSLTNEQEYGFGGKQIYGDQRYDYVSWYEERYRAPIRLEIKYGEDGFPTEDCITSAFKKVIDKQKRYLWLRNIYQGLYQVWQRNWESVTGVKGVKVMANTARQLTLDAADFFLGNPISYSLINFNGKNTKKDDEKLKKLNEIFTRQQLGEHDLSLAIAASWAGVAYEYTYYEVDKNADGTYKLDGKGLPTTPQKTIDMSPLNAAVVYHNDITRTPAFGMYFIEEEGKTFDERKYQYKLNVYTDKICRHFVISKEGGGLKKADPLAWRETDAKGIPLADESVYVGRVPIAELENNSDRKADWEDIVSLFDVQNDILCDRVNDIEMHIDSILLLINKGTSFASYNNEELQALVQGLKAFKTLSLREGEDGKFLSNPLDQTGMQLCLDYNDKLIHKLSRIPDFSDPAMSSLTGRALKVRLRPLISLCNGKASNFRKFLADNRLKIYGQALGIDPATIKMDFTYGIPSDDLETAQTVTPLVAGGIISKETAATRLSFIDNGKDEQEKVKSQNAEEPQMPVDKFKDVDTSEKIDGQEVKGQLATDNLNDEQ